MAIQRRLIEAVEVTENRIHIIRLKDVFDASTVNEFEKVVSYLLARDYYKIIVDLSRVEFVSSAGWGAFTAELRRARQHQGDIKLASMIPDVYDVFLLLELDSFIQSFDTVDETITAFLRPVVTPTPEPAQPYILQEIKAASRSRELAEASARLVAEAAAPNFSERVSQHGVAAQAMDAIRDGGFANERDVSGNVPGDEGRTGAQIEPAVDNAAPTGAEERGGGALNDEKHVDEPFVFSSAGLAAANEEKAAFFMPSDEDSGGEQFEYSAGNDTAESEYEDADTESYNKYGAVEEEYTGDNDSAEYENAAVESDNEYDAVEEEYTGASDSTDEGTIAVTSDEYDEIGQEENADTHDAAGYGYEGSAVEFDDEYGTVEEEEFAGDNDSAEYGYEGYAVESSGAAAPLDYAAGNDTGEFEDTSYASESQDEYGAPGQAEDAADSEASGIEYENLSADPAGNDEVEGWSEYALADGRDEGSFDQLRLPAPAAGGPEMWEMILAGGKSAVDPYMLSKSARLLPDAETPQAPRASEAAHPAAAPGLSENETKFDAGNDAELDAEPGAALDWGFVNEAPSVDSGSHTEDSTALISENELHFSAHAPFVQDNSETAAVSSSAFDEKMELALVDKPAQAESSSDDQFDELETQDIRDPWILDEIDTLPEEYEMEEGAADEDAPPISASELLAYDLDVDTSLSLLPEMTPERKASRERADARVESHAQSEIPSDADAEDSHAGRRDLFARDADSKAPVKPVVAPPVETHEFFQQDDAAEGFSVEAEAPHALPVESEAQLQSGAANSDDDLDIPCNGEAIHNEQPAEALPKIPTEGNVDDILRAVVVTHPDFGPAMICKFLEDRFEPPVSISRSTVYRFLREADLNTREKRQEYAEQLFDPLACAQEL